MHQDRLIMTMHKLDGGPLSPENIAAYEQSDAAKHARAECRRRLAEGPNIVASIDGLPVRPLRLIEGSLASLLEDEIATGEIQPYLCEGEIYVHWNDFIAYSSYGTGPEDWANWEGRIYRNLDD